MAILKEHFELASLLMDDKRSDLGYENSEGESVIDIAQRFDLKQVILKVIDLTKKPRK